MSLRWPSYRCWLAWRWWCWSGSRAASRLPQARSWPSAPMYRRSRLRSCAFLISAHWRSRGPFGQNLQAASGNEIAAEAFGVNVRGYLTAAFVVSSIAIAFAGALLAPRVRILDPDSFGVLESIFMLAYPIVGGMHAVWGGLIGGGGLRILPELLRPVADYQELFFATLVIFVVMFFPG